MSWTHFPFCPTAHRHQPPVLHPTSKEESALIPKKTSSFKNSSFSQDVGQYDLKYLPFKSIYISIILWSKKPLKIKQNDTFMVDYWTNG